MIKKISQILLLIAVCFSASSLFAGDDDFKNKGKGRLILGFGLHFDPNSLGNTIIKDGLDSGVKGRPIIVPDNSLQTLEEAKLAGFGYKSSGPMSAGALTVGYEKDLGENFFWRVGLNLENKISGGHQRGKIMGQQVYESEWTYKAAIVPVYVGIKLNLGEKSSLYMGAGLHYYYAQWDLRGTNAFGAIAIANPAVTTFNSVSPSTTSAFNPFGTQVPIWKEHLRFGGSGIGFNWITGMQTKITEKGFLFLEVETFFSYKMANTGFVKNPGTYFALAANPAYPVSVGGNIYRFGYKHEF
jgi:hypothetical protein